MTESGLGPHTHSPEASESLAYAAADAPISAVPSAAPDYAEFRSVEPTVGGPIEPGQVPAAPATYQPDAVYPDGPTIAPPAAPETPVPIADVPLDRPTTPTTPDEVISDLPFSVPATDPSPDTEVPVELIMGVPTDLPATSAPPPPEGPTLVNPKKPWWRLLLGGD